MKHKYYKSEDNHVLIEVYQGYNRLYICQNCEYLIHRELSSNRLYYNFLCLDEHKTTNCNDILVKEIIE